MSVTKKEKKRRSDIIFGILLASTLGVLLTLFSNLYYDIFVTKTIEWSSVNQNHVFIWMVILLAAWGFISFFIYDYQNEVEMNLGFWKRFMDYFFNAFGPMKIIRVIGGVYLILVLSLIILLLSISLFFFIAKTTNYFTAVLVLITLIGIEILEKRFLKKKK